MINWLTNFNAQYGNMIYTLLTSVKCALHVTRTRNRTRKLSVLNKNECCALRKQKEKYAHSISEI